MNFLRKRTYFSFLFLAIIIVFFSLLVPNILTRQSLDDAIGDLKEGNDQDAFLKLTRLANESNKTAIELLAQNVCVWCRNR